MNRIGEPIAKCIISTLISVTLFSCHMDKESAITLFEQGKKMEKRMLPDSAVIMYQRAIRQSATQKDIELTGIIYNQLGDLYLSHYLFNKSLSAYKLGLKYTQLSSDKTNKSKSLRGIGKSYTYNSKPDSGLIYLSQALLLSKSINDGRKGDIYEDKIADGIRLPKMKTSPLDADTDAGFLSLVNFIQPAPDRDTLHCITGFIPYFEPESERKDGKQLGELSEEKQNFEIYYRLRNALRDVRRETGAELSKVSVTGYGAPVGNLKKNEANALIRALKLKEYLRENRLAGRTLLEVNWISEDWDSITSLVRESDMMLRDATLDLIDNVEVAKGRERMLMSLADGKPYKYLVEKVFPAVMRVGYRIEYTRKPLDAAESLQLLRSGRQRALRLNEFFAVADSYPAGSTEYNDVLDLAARLFPDSPEANINAAAVALSKKELSKARGYLERFATLPIAYNNMGILCLLEGNRDKAEVYLTMAAATGVEQAVKALGKLKIKK